MKPLFGIFFLVLACSQAQARYVIADQDAAGPGGSDMRALMVFLQSPEVDLLGITTVVGDAWRDEETAHALRLLELLGRTDVPVVPGATHPLWRTPEWTRLASRTHGKATWQGAWRDGNPERTSENLAPLREGNPTTKPLDEDAAHFMIRMVHAHPHEITVYGGGPLTNIALAIELDPHFADLAQELVIMGGSIVPQTQEKEWVNSPRHEFNFWFDPEAASVVLRAPWHKITQTTIDISLQTRIDPEILDGVLASHSAAAEYLRKYVQRPVKGIGQFAWDELAAAAWLEPGIIKSERYVYVDVNTDHGANYGDTLTWADEDKPEIPLQKVHVQMELDNSKLRDVLVRLFSAPTPHAHALAPI
jgi:purine nucleosidase